MRSSSLRAPAPAQQIGLASRPNRRLPPRRANSRMITPEPQPTSSTVRPARSPASGAARTTPISQSGHALQACHAAEQRPRQGIVHSADSAGINGSHCPGERSSGSSRGGPAPRNGRKCRQFRLLLWRGGCRQYVEASGIPASQPHVVAAPAAMSAQVCRRNRGAPPRRPAADHAAWPVLGVRPARGRRSRLTAAQRRQVRVQYRKVSRAATRCARMLDAKPCRGLNRPANARLSRDGREVRLKGPRPGGPPRVFWWLLWPFPLGLTSAILRAETGSAEC